MANGWEWSCGHTFGEHGGGACDKPISMVGRAKRAAKLLVQTQADCPKCPARWSEHMFGQCPPRRSR